MTANKVYLDAVRLVAKDILMGGGWLMPIFYLDWPTVEFLAAADNMALARAAQLPDLLEIVDSTFLEADFLSPRAASLHLMSQVTTWRSSAA